ncbi:MAG TPA: hypothetical protein VKT77_02340 [Chthonomonadaceae bacterium]|nr:hypothetical protein [Chthonomonadaceae bacterium]
MNRWIARTAGILAVMAISAGAAVAAPPKTKPATVPCPVCKMPLSKTKSSKNPTAVRLKKGDPVMYCCAACKMPASVLVKPAKKGGKM